MGPPKPSCCNPLNIKHSSTQAKKQKGLQVISEEFLREGPIAFPNFNWRDGLYLCLTCRVKLPKELRKHKALRAAQVIIQNRGPRGQSRSPVLPENEEVPANEPGSAESSPAVDASDPSAPASIVGPNARSVSAGPSDLASAVDPNASLASNDNSNPSSTSVYPNLAHLSPDPNAQQPQGLQPESLPSYSALYPNLPSEAVGEPTPSTSQVSKGLKRAGTIKLPF